MSDILPLSVKDAFPGTALESHGKPLSYLDTAASSLTPRRVTAAVNRYYQEESVNVHRGVYALSEHATGLFEEARATVQRFLNARSPAEIVFTAGTTAAINLVARSYGDSFVGSGEAVLVTCMEHHSNIVPWQMLCERTGAELRILPVSDTGELDRRELDGCLGDNTRLVAVAHVSNVLGTVNPVQPIVERAHARGARVLVDGAQAAACRPVDVQELDCDFYAFSGHKVFGPTGIGILYGKRDLLESMPPAMGGGDMIESVTFEGSTYAAPPRRFEAGTPHVAGAIGLGEALRFITELGVERIARHEEALRARAEQGLRSVPGLRVVGDAPVRAGIISFVLDGVHPHDVASVLDAHGIAVRAGHHCAQPLMRRLGLAATTRASFSVYNTEADVDRLVKAVRDVRGIFAHD